MWRGSERALKQTLHTDSYCTTSTVRSYLVLAGYTGVEFMEGIQCESKATRLTYAHASGVWLRLY